MKKMFCFIMISVLLLTTCIVSAGAIPAPHFYGDVNCDSSTDVLDATEIQRSIAGLTELSLLGEMLADVDADERVSVMDATMIQRKVAGLIRYFNQKEDGIFTYIDFDNLTANFDTMNSMAGVPVTFTTDASCIVGNPLSYQYEVYSIQSEEPIYVSQLSESSEFTYTFEKTGHYIINSIVYNIFGEWQMYDMPYYVGEYSDDNSLMVSAINKNHLNLNKFENITITADAYGGTAPYEYKFEFNFGENKKVQEFSQSNSFEIGTLPIGNYRVKVTVKDANGDEVTSTFDFEVEEPITG